MENYHGSLRQASRSQRSKRSKQVRKHTYLHAHTHTTCKYTPIVCPLLGGIQAYIHTYLHTCMTYTHTCIHCIHTYIFVSTGITFTVVLLPLKKTCKKFPLTIKCSCRAGNGKGRMLLLRRRVTSVSLEAIPPPQPQRVHTVT